MSIISDIAKILNKASQPTASEKAWSDERQKIPDTVAMKYYQQYQTGAIGDENKAQGYQVDTKALDRLAENITQVSSLKQALHQVYKTQPNQFGTKKR